MSLKTFLDSLKGCMKKVDSDKLAETIEKNSNTAAKAAASAGIISHAQVNKVDKAAKMGAKQLDAYGDKNPHLFAQGEKPVAADPNAPKGEAGAQPDANAPTPGVAAPAHAASAPAAAPAVAAQA